ncbi:hypothetical protein BTR22_19220 [Alkalihalophilus pseudofirmus]|nr:hypothetical protein BTR22_19220 [Alkalihalophilus pseudofirmus]
MRDLAKKKEYEIGFSLGAKMDNTFSKAFNDTKKQLEDMQKNARRAGDSSRDMSRQIQRSGQTSSASVSRTSKTIEEMNQKMRQNGSTTQQTMSRMARRTDGFGQTFRNVSNNVMSGLGAMAAKTTSTANQMIQSFSRITPNFNRVAGNISSGVTNTMILPFKSAIGMVQQYAGALGLLSGGALANSGMARLSAIENAEVSLRVMMGDADKAGAFLDDVLAFARTTPFAFPDLAETARNLTAFGMDTKKVVPTMKAIGDAAAASGKGSEGLRQIASAFGAMQVSGTLSLGEVNRLMDAGIPALKILANQTGKSVEQMKKDISSGAYDSVSAIDMLVEGMQQGTDGVAGATAAMDGIMEEMKDTWTGSVDSLKSSISSTMATLMEPAKPRIQAAMAWFGNTFSKLPKLVSTIGDITAPFRNIASDIFGSLNIGSSLNSIGASITSFVSPWIEGFKLLNGGFGDINERIAKYGGSVSDYVGEGTLAAVGKIQSGINTVRSVIEKVGNGFSSFWDKHGATISNFSQKVVGGFVELIQLRLNQMAQFWDTHGSSILQTAKLIFSSVGSFIGEKVSQITSFWNENGEQIMQALKNIGGFLRSTFMVLLPIIGAIVKAVWGNIQGVITGAIRIIQGVIKTFSSLLTGDFRGMWEGIKEIFFGGIQFVWNLIQLYFVGRIIGGIRALVVNARSSIANMWSGIRTFFTNGVTNANQSIINFVSGIRNGFSNARKAATEMAKQMWDAVKRRFDDMVSGARALPGRIGDGIKAMASKAVEGVKSLGNDLMGGLASAINGVVGGLNWISGKVGISANIPEWSPPRYAKGTDSHPGGLAIVGDGGGSELIRTPDGRVGLSPSTDTLVNLPKGSQVLPHNQTKQFMGMGIPAYAKGTGGISKVVDAAFNIFDYIGSPSKLLNTALDMMGVKIPSLGGAFGDILKGSFSFVKEQAVGWVKDKLDVFGKSMNTFGNLRMTSPFGMRKHPITGEWKMHNGVDYGGPMGYPIKANVGGIVSSSGWRGGYGNTVMVQQGPLTHLYAHLQRAIARVGQLIRPGDLLGLLGSTGNSTGPHLHYEVRQNGRAINPMSFVKGFAKGGKVNRTQTAWVGEEGPELLDLPGGSRVYNNRDSMAMVKGPNGDTYIFSPNIYFTGNEDQSTFNQYMKMTYEEFKKFIERYKQERKRLGLA